MEIDGKVTLKEVYAIVQRLEDKIDNMISALNTRIDDLDKRYVTKVEFWPVKAIVYGGAAIVLTAVFGFLITLVIK